MTISIITRLLLSCSSKGKRSRNHGNALRDDQVVEGAMMKLDPVET
ncbi:unnamed protein product [Rhodiola kirilowii]